MALILTEEGNDNWHSSQGSGRGYCRGRLRSRLPPLRRSWSAPAAQLRRVCPAPASLATATRTGEATWTDAAQSCGDGVPEREVHTTCSPCEVMQRRCLHRLFPTRHHTPVDVLLLSVTSKRADKHGDGSTQTASPTGTAVASATTRTTAEAAATTNVAAAAPSSSTSLPLDKHGVTVQACAHCASLAAELAAAKAQNGLLSSTNESTRRHFDALEREMQRLLERCHRLEDEKASLLSSVAQLKERGDRVHPHNMHGDTSW